MIIAPGWRIAFMLYQEDRRDGHSRWKAARRFIRYVWSAYPAKLKYSDRTSWLPVPTAAVSASSPPRRQGLR